MENYKKMSKPPEWAIKKIEAGRHKGMSDIKPQWRYEIMTEVFGPCGFGWWWTVDSVDYRDCNNGEIVVIAKVSLYWKDGDKVSEAIPGFGGDKLVKKESAGLFVDEDAVKKAVTDALGKAMQLLGVGAEVYRGTNNTANEFASSIFGEALTEGDKKVKRVLEELKIEQKDFKIWLRSIGIAYYTELLEPEKTKIADRIKRQGGLEEMAKIEAVEELEI